MKQSFPNEPILHPRHILRSFWSIFQGCGCITRTFFICFTRKSLHRGPNGKYYSCGFWRLQVLSFLYSHLYFHLYFQGWLLVLQVLIWPQELVQVPLRAGFATIKGDDRFSFTHMCYFGQNGPPNCSVLDLVHYILLKFPQ